MSVIHEGSSAFSAAQDFIVQFNVGARATKQDRISGKNFAKGVALTHSSIMKATRDLTMRFPVICSDTISPGAAAMVTKAIERNCTTTLQLLFASTYLRGDNGMDVLRKFHKNIDDSITMDDYLNMADALTKAIDSTGVVTAGGGKLATAVNFINGFGESCTEKDFIVKAAKDIKEQVVLDDDYMDRSISGYHITEAADGGDEFTVVFKEDALKHTSYSKLKDDLRRKAASAKGYNFNPDPIVRDPGNPNSDTYVSTLTGKVYKGPDLIENPWANTRGVLMTKDQFEANMSVLKYSQDNQKQIFDKLKANTDYNLAMAKNDIESEKLKLAKSTDKYKRKEDQYAKIADYQRSQLDYFQKQLLDNDVKKCNELVPSLIIIRYANVDATEITKTAVEQQFIAGVKAWMYPETSANIIGKIEDVFDNNKGKLGWIKATTGEINFMKDFLLGISKAKIAAKQDAYERVSPIWKHLKYRSNKSVLNRLIKNKPNDAGAITTLVLSSEEVDYLKKELDIDLTDIKSAQKLMDAYNFMGIVIVDENFEVARFLFDGAAYYEDLAFSSLEREDKDSSYKKVVNLISKINRG